MDRLERLDLAFQALIASHLHTEQQRQIGERREVGPLMCVHYDFEQDGSRREIDYFFIWGTPPAEAIAAIRAYGPADSHTIFVVNDKAGVGQAYWRSDMRLQGIHTLMVHEMNALEPVGHSFLIKVATRPGDILYLNMMEGGGSSYLSDLRDPTLRHYYLVEDGLPVAKARSSRLSTDVSWLSNLYTVPDYRGRGMAGALVSRILADSAAAGARLSMLLSTDMAYSLYREAGYRRLAPLFSFRLVPS